MRPRRPPRATPSAIAAIAAASAARLTAAARRISACSSGLFTRRSASTSPETSQPLGGDRAGQPPPSPWLRPAVHISSPSRAPASRARGDHRAARSAAVSLSEWPANSAAVTCRSIVTRSIARVTSTGVPSTRDDEQVRREIAPVVEPGQPEDVLRRGEDRRLQPAGRELRPDPRQARFDLAGGERVPVHRDSSGFAPDVHNMAEHMSREIGGFMPAFRQDSLPAAGASDISCAQLRLPRQRQTAEPTQGDRMLMSELHPPDLRRRARPRRRSSPARPPSRSRRSRRPRPTATSASASPTRRRSASRRRTAS